MPVLYRRAVAQKPGVHAYCYRLNLLTKLAQIAAREGRTLDDLLFEAIEEYLLARGWSLQREYAT